MNSEMSRLNVMRLVIFALVVLALLIGWAYWQRKTPSAIAINQLPEDLQQVAAAFRNACETNRTNEGHVLRQSFERFLREKRTRNATISREVLVELLGKPFSQIERPIQEIDYLTNKHENALVLVTFKFEHGMLWRVNIAYGEK